MTFVQNAIRNIQTTLLGLAPLALGLYLIHRGFKAGDVQQILEGFAALSGGAGLVAAKDAGKSGTITLPR